MNIGRPLMILGIATMVIGEIYGIISLMISWTPAILSQGIAMTLILGPLWQGGLIVGIGKIVAHLEASPRSSTRSLSDPSTPHGTGR
ncbi:MAG: hypothetical protein OWU33_09185 [Firmicutes bacterium]|nr:hypothetical protein [Bacillota bacterium]